MVERTVLVSSNKKQDNGTKAYGCGNKSMVMKTKTYGCGNKFIVVGTNLWLWEQIYGCRNKFMVVGQIYGWGTNLWL
jgi:hypothetical protein